MRIQQCRFQRRCGQDFQVSPANFGVGIFAGDRFALLGQADLTVHSTRRLGDYRFITRPAAATDGAAATVKQAQADAVGPAKLDQADFGLVELPARRDVTAILVAVGVAEHDLLQAAAAVDQATVRRDRQEPIHDLDAVAQIRDGLEQRHDIDRAVAFCVTRPASLRSTARVSRSETPRVFETIDVAMESEPYLSWLALASRRIANSFWVVSE